MLVKFESTAVLAHCRTLDSPPKPSGGVPSQVLQHPGGISTLWGCPSLGGLCALIPGVEMSRIERTFLLETIMPQASRPVGGVHAHWAPRIAPPGHCRGYCKLGIGNTGTGGVELAGGSCRGYCTRTELLVTCPAMLGGVIALTTLVMTDFQSRSTSQMGSTISLYAFRNGYPNKSPPSISAASIKIFWHEMTMSFPWTSRADSAI